MLDAHCRNVSKGKVVLALLIAAPLLPTGCASSTTTEAPASVTVPPQEQAIRNNPGIPPQQKEEMIKRLRQGNASGQPSGG